MTEPANPQPVSLWIDGLHYRVLTAGKYVGLTIRHLPTPRIDGDREIWHEHDDGMSTPVGDDTPLTIEGGERFTTNRRLINAG